MSSFSFDNIINKIRKKKKLLPKTINIGNHSQIQNDCEIKSKCIERERKKSNWISTTKYTLLTFIPRNIIFEQFRKFTNLYFLLILILSWIPQISPVQPGPSSINLAIVLLINAVKEGYEDFRRYQSDKKINNQKCKVVENNQIIEKCWKELIEGDIVLIEDGEQFPTDLILLATSGESSPGHCYIETSNLDGETNLKYKQALLQTNSLLVNNNSNLIPPNCGNQSSVSIESFNYFKENKSTIDCEAPSVNLNKFDGAIQMNVDDRSSRYPLTIDQLLVRGTTLMSTKWIYGCVIYVGHETKYMMNTMATPTKRSKLELTMERILIYLLGVQLLLCLFSTLMGLKSDLQYSKNAWYLLIDHNYGFATFQRYFTFLILYSTIIPISLYVTLEIIRFLQVIFINKDKKMRYRDDQGNKIFACARTSNLNEELGMVEYIFSDKTGTLTRNEMEFKTCCINGKQYGNLPITSEDLNEIDNLTNSLNNNNINNNNSTNNLNQIELNNLNRSSSGILHKSNSNINNLIQQQLQLDKNGNSKNNMNIDINIKENYEFLVALALCNTVVPEHDDINDITTSNTSNKTNTDSCLTSSNSSSSSTTDKIKYSSSSPDETALVNEAKKLGFILYSRTSNTITIKVPIISSNENNQTITASSSSSSSSNTNGSQFKTYNILNLIEFTSNRKRMSIIVKDLETNEITLYCKGADSTILPLVDDFNTNKSNNLVGEVDTIMNTTISDSIMDKTNESLKLFSVNGLRTLCITKRLLTQQEYDKWNDEYKESCLSMEDRDVKMEETSKLIECKLSLMGVTAIEDRLQKNVSKTISSLLKANIKIWMITGDKQETAINIGLSCSLLSNLELLILNENSINSVKSSILNLINLIDNNGIDINNNTSNNNGNLLNNNNNNTEQSQITDSSFDNESLSNYSSSYRGGCSSALSESNDIDQSSFSNKNTNSNKHQQQQQKHQQQKEEEEQMKNENEKNGKNDKKQFGLVIDGNTLSYILLSKECEDLFYKLVSLCKSCVCCRVTPFQKSEVVRIVKQRTNSITLAIGDGANDVSMIQAAHIGIGINGLEGSQAVLASDFSIAQFRYLERLLLIHGRYNYKRLCTVICYFFFKNLLSCLLQFWYSTNNLFSGTTFYDSLNTMLFNLIFTALPIVVVGVFERDLSSKFLLKYPQLYRETQKGKCFNHKVFWSWIFLSIYCSAVIFFFSAYIFNESATNYSGKVGGVRNVSALAFTGMVFVVNLRLAMIIQHWNILCFLSIGLSLAVYFLVECIYSLVYSFIGYRGEFYHVFLNVVEQPIFYISLILIILVCLIPPLTIKFIQRTYFPSPLDIVQEIQYSFKKQLKKKLINV